jgi:hypothetical protein
MIDTFLNASAFNQPIESWDTSSVSDIKALIETMGYSYSDLKTDLILKGKSENEITDLRYATVYNYMYIKYSDIYTWKMHLLAPYLTVLEDDQKVKFSWVPPSNYEVLPPSNYEVLPPSYHIWYKKVTETEFTKLSAGITENSTDITGLVNGVVYHVKLGLQYKTSDNVLFIAWSPLIQFKPFAVPDAVDSLTLLSIGSTNMRFSWTPTTDEQLNGMNFLRYELVSDRADITITDIQGSSMEIGVIKQLEGGEKGTDYKLYVVVVATRPINGILITEISSPSNSFIRTPFYHPSGVTNFGSNNFNDGEKQWSEMTWSQGALNGFPLLHNLVTIHNSDNTEELYSGTTTTSSITILTTGLLLNTNVLYKVSITPYTNNLHYSQDDNDKTGNLAEIKGSIVHYDLQVLRAPVITVNTGTDTVDQNSTWTDAGASSDGGETVTVTGTVDTEVTGTYIIDYTATDAAGNIGTATRTVTIAVRVMARSSTIIEFRNSNHVTVDSSSNGWNFQFKEEVLMNNNVRIWGPQQHIVDVYNGDEKVGSMKWINATLGGFIFSTVQAIFPSSFVINVGDRLDFMEL